MINANEIREELKSVYDPEIRINIVDLGLIYDIDCSKLPEIKILMTFTAPNCPVSEQILNDVRNTALKIAGVEDVKIEITWDPPWTREMISEEGQLIMSFDM